MDPTVSTWTKMIESIEVHRDIRARFFKPTCVIAVCNLIDQGVGSFTSLSAKLVVEEFERLVSNLFPNKASQGWMPMWHLMSDGAWICKKDGVPTRREDFPLTKPRSKNGLLKVVDTIDCSSQFGVLWKSKKSRNQLRTMMIALLLADQDKEANLIGEYLHALNSNYRFDVCPSNDSHLNPVDLFATENYAKLRVHTRIERDAKIPIAVKKLQGYSCLACGLNFENVYGKLGSNYIEAHHVVPVAKNQGSEKQVSLIDDFVVLCANCHRMIHRLGEPWTRDRLKELKSILSLNRQ
jgi:predicted restriction endonuclease